MTDAERVKLDFYALGRVDDSICRKNINIHTNKGIADTSGDLMTRNALSLNSNNLSHIRNNYRNLHTLGEANKEKNNYLNPIAAFNSQQKFDIPSNAVNKEIYNIERRKFFSKDKDISENENLNGNKVSLKDYMNKKNALPLVNKQSGQILQENYLYFDKNNQQMIRYPKGFWNHNLE
jgi:hypothetical protein